MDAFLTVSTPSSSGAAGTVAGRAEWARRKPSGSSLSSPAAVAATDIGGSSGWRAMPVPGRTAAIRKSSTRMPPRAALLVHRPMAANVTVDFAGVSRLAEGRDRRLDRAPLAPHPKAHEAE